MGLRRLNVLLMCCVTLTENINNVVYEARTCFNFATNLFKDIDKFINDNEKRFGNGTEK